MISVTRFRCSLCPNLEVRLGTEFMEYLFSHPHLAVFLPLENNCFTQLCGRPVYMIEPICKVEERTLKRKRRIEREMAKLTRKKRRSNEQAGTTAGMPVPSRLAIDPDPQLDDLRRSAELAIEASENKFARPPVMVEIVRNRMFYGKWGWRGDKRLPGVGLPVNRQ